jgi:hypothetical protein
MRDNSFIAIFGHPAFCLFPYFSFLNRRSLEAILEERRPITNESIAKVNVTRMTLLASGIAIGGWTGFAPGPRPGLREAR